LINKRTKEALQAKMAQGARLGKPENLTTLAVRNSLATRVKNAKSNQMNQQASGYIKVLRESQGMCFEKIAKEGWSLRDILAHGVIDYHPVIVGPGIEAADHMQAWFEAVAADGFWISPDVNADGIDAFVDEVVPILQE
jgi:alkanesulfonate monooxygenase SsuD/methylene tetrahydromethanopterin reductase-like flavin-dependent oxidoreductase (luciferase family)